MNLINYIPHVTNIIVWVTCIWLLVFLWRFDNKLNKIIAILNLINGETLHTRIEVQGLVPNIHHCWEVNERILETMKTNKFLELSDEEMVDFVRNSMRKYTNEVIKEDL